MSREIFEDTRKHGLDTEMGFLARWSVLSGGTFSLLIPLIQSLSQNMVFKYLFIIGEIFLLASLIVALVGTFAVRGYIQRRSECWPSDTTGKWVPFYQKTRRSAPLVALLTYVVGIVFIALFINLNLL